MADTDLDRLETHLRSYIVPATGAPLGSNGTSLTLEADAETCHVRIETGFPIAYSREAMITALTAHCADLKLAAPPTFELTAKIEAHAVQQGLKPLDGVSNVIAVASGKGGVGKSTVAANLALALAQEGATVGLLDADIYGPSQPRMLGLTGERPETRDGKSIEPLRAYDLQVMSIGFLIDDAQPMAWRGPMVTSALTQLLADTRWDALDYLFIDMPPGTGDIQLTLAQRVPVSGAIIVTTPQNIALDDARKGLEMFRKVHVPILGVVENMGVHICSNCGHAEAIFGEAGGERLAGDYDVPVLGSLPLDRAIQAHSEAGRPTVVAEPEGAVAAAYRTIALRAAGVLAASGKDYSRLFPKITVEESA
jgi:ATP-binding protein involved in chromosome partitioning